MMGLNWAYAFLISTLILEIYGEKAIKCYICNSADPTPQANEALCRNPKAYSNFTTTECTPQLMRELNGKWMNKEWLHHHFNHDDDQVNPKDTEWEFGAEKKPGYELKCMKEVLHKNSKEWLKNQKDSFSQVVRFCEYRKVTPEPDNCEKTCSDEQLSKGSCYICCNTDGCNGTTSLGPMWLTVFTTTILLILMTSKSIGVKTE